jgi:hypothetical protein
MTQFFLEQTWAGYKNLTVEGKQVAFVYAWEEVLPEYLEEVEKKYPQFFELESESEDTSLLKIKPGMEDKLTLSVLLDVVDNDETEWFELIDLDTHTLLNTDRLGEESTPAEILSG